MFYLTPPVRLAVATGAAEDLEMKRILWALLSDLGRRDQENLELIVAADFMGALLTYLDVDALDAASYDDEGSAEGRGVGTGETVGSSEGADVGDDDGSGDGTAVGSGEGAP